MTESTLEEFIKKFNIISNNLAADEYNRPQLIIKMRMNWNDKESAFYADLEYVEIKKGCILEGAYGNGSTPEEAVCDYYNRIKGKKLVYRAMNKKYRRECVVV